ncbi:hypothetical protein PA598K_00423 [Paenibacillus sp. 598K]|uniref:copper resistance CopC family protein n=1 Tax=Paenibacillus sp. 598K TaxID=1117987 RepID=UPI000FFA43DE|nr:copper resistance CopC family protein [Paenibacillus sp. 598K]GBF72186.1 hypothetical protein PA598K_00423 [Paenibacillus sp. 598K]
MKRTYRMFALFAVTILLGGLFGLGMAQAHTTLSSATPEPDSTVTEELTAIELKFNTDVEPLSTFKLLLNGEEQPIGPIEVDGQYLRSGLSDPLPNGDYTVAWKIVGEDGHPIESQYSFTLNAPVQAPAEEPVREEAPAAEQAPDTTTAEQTPETKEEAVPGNHDTEPSQDAAPANNETQPSQGAEADKEKESSGSNPAVWIGLGAALIGIIAGTLSVVRAKRNGGNGRKQ